MKVGWEESKSASLLRAGPITRVCSCSAGFEYCRDGNPTGTLVPVPAHSVKNPLPYEWRATEIKIFDHGIFP